MTGSPPKALVELSHAIESRQYDKAEQICRRILAKDPRSRDALFALSVVFHRKGDIERALQQASSLMQIDSNSERSAVWVLRLLLEAGRFTEAIALGKTATSKWPTPYSWSLLAHSYEGLGQFADAVRCFDAAIALQPNHAPWHYHKAAALIASQREFEAMEALRIATKLAPTPDGLLKQSEYELQFGQPSRSLETSAAILKANPLDAAANVLAARALMQLRRGDEAEGHWRSAIANSPEPDQIAVQKAEALSLLGEFDEAIGRLRAIANEHPGHARALSQIATLKKIRDEDRPLVAEMKQALEREDLSFESRVLLEYSVGKSYDNLGEYEKAMAHFDEANRILQARIEETGGFDVEELAMDVAARTEVFSAAELKKLSAYGNESDAPVFVLGMIRSGTTLAEQILSSHPEIQGAGEQDFWPNSELLIVDPARRTTNGPILAERAKIFLRLLRGFSADAKRIVDKQPGNLMIAGLLHAAYPNARIVMMRRKPIDTAISIWTTGSLTGLRFVRNKANIVAAFKEIEKLKAHWRTVLPSNRFLEVEYESLIDDRESVTRRMIDFCGLPWSDACLAPEANFKVVSTPSVWQVRQPVYRSSVDRWKNYEPWLGEFRDLLG